MRPAAPRPPGRLRRRLARIAPLVFLRHAGRPGLPPGRALAAAWRARSFRCPTRADADVLWEVVVADAYGLVGTRLRPPDVVVDVGAHVGSFALLAHLLGSRRIESHEAHPRHAAWLRRNLRPLPGARAVHAAVVRSDRPVPERLPPSGFDPANPGESTVLFGGRRMAWGRGAPLRTAEGAPPAAPTLPLDRILEQHRRVRLLKLDCEGSEFPILWTSRLLDRVEEIVAEAHEVPPEVYPRVDDSARLESLDRFDPAELAGWLREAGFRVTTRPGGPGTLILRARRWRD